jgi:hypothetical protein
VLNVNDYHPFGIMMPNRNYSVKTGYRYGFNGKENDNEVKGEGNQRVYGMRIYDPRLGRILSVIYAGVQLLYRDERGTIWPETRTVFENLVTAYQNLGGNINFKRLYELR